MRDRNGMSREPVVLVPAMVEESMAESHPGRGLEAAGASLALEALGGTPAVPQEPGRPADTPAAPRERTTP